MADTITPAEYKVLSTFMEHPDQPIYEQTFNTLYPLSNRCCQRSNCCIHHFLECLSNQFLTLLDESNNDDMIVEITALKII